MKVLFIVTGLDRGGAEAMLFNLLTHIKKESFNCSVICLKDMGFYGEKIAKLGVPVFCLKLDRKYIFPYAISTYIRLILRFKPDIIQGWMYHANLFSAIAKIFYPNAKIIFNVTHSILNSKDTYFTECIIKINSFFSNFVSKVINCSKNSILQHQKIGFSKKNSVYIANGFDLELFKPDKKLYVNFRSKYNLDSKTKIIGNIGRYHPVKNHIGLLYTFQKIKNYYPFDVVFVLAGSGLDKNNRDIFEKIMELELQDSCILLGAVLASQVIPVFDVYLSSSWSEAFPNVLGEAMACGVPCVATDVGDCKFLIDRYGHVSASGDYEDLAKNCIESFNMCDERKSAMRQHISLNYSIQKITEKYEDIYKEIYS